MEFLDARKEDGVSLKKRVELAKQLGHKRIVVLVDAVPEDIVDVEFVLLAKTLDKVQSLSKKGTVIAPAKREFFESKIVKYILNPEEGNHEDFIHHRNSGLNQVLLKLCEKNSKEIITTLALLRKDDALGRMRQNIAFCKKYNVPYHITSGAADEWGQRADGDLKALVRVLSQ